jgi:uncharacterized membrane protein
VLAAAEDWTLFFHLIGAFLFAGGALVAAVAFEVARRRELPAEIATLLGLARIGARLVAGGAVVVLPFGLWLTDLGDFGYGAGWIDAALGLFGLTVVLGAAGGQTPKRARRLAVQLARDGSDATPQLRALLDDRVALVLNYLSGAAVVAIVALMAFKPGGPA